MVVGLHLQSTIWLALFLLQRNWKDFQIWIWRITVLLLTIKSPTPGSTRQDLPRQIRDCLRSLWQWEWSSSPRNFWKLEVKAEGDGGCVLPHLPVGWYFHPLCAGGWQCCCLLVTGGQVPGSWSDRSHNKIEKRKTNPKLTVHSRSLRLRRPWSSFCEQGWVRHRKRERLLFWSRPGLLQTLT